LFIYFPQHVLTSTMTVTHVILMCEGLPSTSYRTWNTFDA
jgi:hypothetical protein